MKFIAIFVIFLNISCLKITAGDIFSFNFADVRSNSNTFCYVILKSLGKARVNSILAHDKNIVFNCEIDSIGCIRKISTPLYSRNIVDSIDLHKINRYVGKKRIYIKAIYDPEPNLDIDIIKKDANKIFERGGGINVPIIFPYRRDFSKAEILRQYPHKKYPYAYWVKLKAKQNSY